MWLSARYVRSVKWVWARGPGGGARHVARAPGLTPNGERSPQGKWCLPLRPHGVFRRDALRPVTQDLHSYLEKSWRTWCPQPARFVVKGQPQKALAA